MIEHFIPKIKDRLADKHGGNKKCYIEGAYAILAGSFNPEDIRKTSDIGKQLATEGVAIVPIIEYRADGTPGKHGYVSGFILQRKAPGEELHSGKETEEIYAGRLRDLAERPPEFYDKFIGDWLKITDAGLAIDPSKSSNFFYTPEQIYFIDLTAQKRKMTPEQTFHEAAVVLFNGGMYYKYPSHRSLQQNIIRKLSASCVKYGADADKIAEITGKHFPDIAGNQQKPTPVRNYSR